ncbi:MAG: glycosyltransferase [Endomicrobia bacterium]|nr:glycosyltransferase [Endomicrobiia bacterium]MCX7716045.1 glycosyltransferase [Endomicrobiia bacterium]
MKQKNKIFYIITSLDYGGTQQQLYYLLKHWKSENYFPVVVALKTGGRFELKIKRVCKYVYSLGLPLTISLKSYFLILIAYIKFLLLIINHRPKILHSFLFQANIFAKLAKLFFWNIKVISSERVAEKQKLWQHKISMLTNFLVDKVMVNSNDLKNFIIKYQKLNPKKIVVVPNMMDLQEVKTKIPPETIRKELGIDNDIFVICSVGRLHKQKGYDLLLEVVKNIVDECNMRNIQKKFIFIIIGDGEEYKNLLSYTYKLGINNFVKFLGYRENVYDYINMCNLFVLTSYWEGSPNVIIEALTMGKPILSTEVEGVKEILDERFIIPLDVKREEVIKIFKEKILNIYEEYKNGQFLECKKKDFILFTPENVMQSFLTLYY